LVERWFAELTNKRIRRGVFRSVKELETAIREYIAVHNENPKPFVWTRTADQILASIARYAQRTVVALLPDLCHEPLGQETSFAKRVYEHLIDVRGRPRYTAATDPGRERFSD
jgi:hypothetical protein